MKFDRDLSEWNEYSGTKDENPLIITPFHISLALY